MKKKELKQIIADQQKYIKLLEEKVEANKFSLVPWTNPIPACVHEYDTNSTVPVCKKCGQFIFVSSHVTITTTGCQHEYPNFWHGITPPSCIKCGKSEPSITTIYGCTS